MSTFRITFFRPPKGFALRGVYCTCTCQVGGNIVLGGMVMIIQQLWIKILHILAHDILSFLCASVSMSSEKQTNAALYRLSEPCILAPHTSLHILPMRPLMSDRVIVLTVAGQCDDTGLCPRLQRGSCRRRLATVKCGDRSIDGSSSFHQSAPASAFILVWCCCCCWWWMTGIGH